MPFALIAMLATISAGMVMWCFHSGSALRDIVVGDGCPEFVDRGGHFIVAPGHLHPRSGSTRRRWRQGRALSSAAPALIAAATSYLQSANVVYMRSSYRSCFLLILIAYRRLDSRQPAIVWYTSHSLALLYYLAA